MLKLLSLKWRLIIGSILVVSIAGTFLLGAVLFIIGFGASSASASCLVPVNEVPDAPGESATEQIANARIIDETAASLGLSGAASRVAIIAAFGESSLINIDYGDNAMNPDGTVADSAGLFQQQPQMGWGTAEQVRDPEYATTSFLIGPGHDRAAGLVAVEGWETLEPTTAIHTVQRNLDPNHYARYYTPADQIIQQAGIDISRAGTTAPAGTSPEGAAPAQPATECAASGGSAGSGEAAFPLDKPFNQTSGYGPRTSPTAGASSWHPAVDLQNQPACGSPVYAVVPGTVTVSDRLWLSIQHPDGYTVSYLHMSKSDRTVAVGQTVTMGQQVGAVGTEPPSTGCHLDIRINTVGTTNAALAAIPTSETQSGPPGYVDPALFFEAFGLTLCDETCTRY